ncbi:MAG: hypothetical protein ACE5FZ_05785 [Nitrospiria bacterium]
MSKKVRTLLFLSSLVIFFTWGFRLFVLYNRWQLDPLRIPHLLITLAYFGLGGFLLRLGIQGARTKRRDYSILIYASVFTVVYWSYRWGKVVLYPENDPNPRSHLHLASLYLVMGGLLLVAGWCGRKRLQEGGKNNV